MDFGSPSRKRINDLKRRSVVLGSQNRRLCFAEVARSGYWLLLPECHFTL
jgi:hypothetical protein